MKKISLLLICLLLMLALAGCQPQGVELLPNDATSAPQDVPSGEINGSVIIRKG